MPTTELMPSRVRLFAPVEVKPDDGGAPRPFAMVAYTGAPVDVGDDAPWIFDLAGMEHAGRKPIFRDHDSQKLVGHGEAVLGSNGLSVRGSVLAGTPFLDAAFVSLASDQGFPWQASVGLDVLESYRLGAGEFAEVNGRRVEGPIYVGSKTRLNEVSFVPLGADGATSAVVLERKREAAMPEDVMAPEEEQEAPATLADLAAQFSVMQEQMARLMEPTPTPDPESDAEAMDDGEEEKEMTAQLSAAKRIRDEFADDPQFALEQICAGSTLTEAKAAYSDHVASKLQAANAKVAQLEAKLAKRAGQGPVGVADEGDGEVKTVGKQDFVAQARAKAKREGISRTEAMKRLARERAKNEKGA